MKRNAVDIRYPLSLRKWAHIDALNHGWSVKDTVSNPRCIEWMTIRCEVLLESERTTPSPRPTVDRPDVPAPHVIPDTDYEASSDFFGTLAGVGTLRGLHLVADGRGGYTATIKITLPDGRQVYRYGRLHAPVQLVSMLEHTILKDRWTPDKA